MAQAAVYAAIAADDPWLALLELDVGGEGVAEAMDAIVEATDAQPAVWSNGVRCKTPPRRLPRVRSRTPPKLRRP